MFGFLVGFACLWGLVRVIRCGRGHGGACGGGWRSRHSWRRGGGGWDGERKSWWMRSLFERLDTTPGQEKEIKKAVSEVMDAASALKDDLRSTRADIGTAFKSEVLDEDTMAELLTRNDDKLDELRRAVVGGLARIHATLDKDQRDQLARWLQSNRRWGGSPYRTYA